MRWIEDDGGRADAGFRGSAGDCGTRAVAIGTGQDYRTVYDALAALNGKTVRDGTPREVVHRYLTERGWTWHPTMSIGTGAAVHLRAEELPSGRIITRLSRHFAAVIDGVIHDTFDPSRDGTRCVYGYWQEG